MKKTILPILFTFLVMSRLSMAGTDLLHRHAHAHRVQLKSNSSSFKTLFLRHEPSEAGPMLSIKGVLKESWDEEFSKAIIVATFTGKNGEPIAEERIQVNFDSNSSAAKEKTIFIQTEDSFEIVQCDLNVEWGMGEEE